MTDGFFPAPAAGAFFAVGFGDGVSCGFGGFVFDQFELGNVDELAQGFGVGLGGGEIGGREGDAGFEGFADLFFLAGFF